MMVYISHLEFLLFLKTVGIAFTYEQQTLSQRSNSITLSITTLCSIIATLLITFLLKLLALTR